MGAIQVKHDDELKILAFTVTGEYSVSDDLTTVGRVVEEWVEKRCARFLGDFRGCSFSVDTLAAIDRARLFEDLGMGRSFRFAILLDDISDNARFYETALANRGWQVRVFSSSQEAKDWLTK